MPLYSTKPATVEAVQYDGSMQSIADIMKMARKTGWI